TVFSLQADFPDAHEQYLVHEKPPLKSRYSFTVSSIICLASSTSAAVLWGERLNRIAPYRASFFLPMAFKTWLGSSRREWQADPVDTYNPRCSSMCTSTSPRSTPSNQALMM